MLLNRALVILERDLYTQKGPLKSLKRVVCTLWTNAYARAFKCCGATHTATHCNTLQHIHIDRSRCTLQRTVFRIKCVAGCTRPINVNVLQCVAACVAVCWPAYLMCESLRYTHNSPTKVLQCVAIGCNVLQCVLQCDYLHIWCVRVLDTLNIALLRCCSVLQCAAIGCTVL